MILNKIGVLSAAKISAITMGIMGIFIGLIYVFLGAMFGALAGSAGLSAGLGFGAIIILPLLYAVMGFVGGALYAFIYNLVAGWVGGIELDFGK